jgi:hypothetical protein
MTLYYINSAGVLKAFVLYRVTSSGTLVQSTLTRI